MAVANSALPVILCIFFYFEAILAFPKRIGVIESTETSAALAQFLPALPNLKRDREGLIFPLRAIDRTGTSATSGAGASPVTARSIDHEGRRIAGTDRRPFLIAFLPSFVASGLRRMCRHRNIDSCT
jgi:hypothetical protein